MHQVNQIASKEFYCFDCDGVLWRGKEPIPEARELLIRLRDSVIHLLLLYSLLLIRTSA